MTDKKLTRVAIVRCDSHAYWFAPYLAPIDPLVLATKSDDAPTRQEVHFLGCARGDYSKMAMEVVPGFEITKVFDRVGDGGFENTDPESLQYGSYPGRAVAFSETILSRPEVCDTAEQAATDVDAAFICDSSSPKDGADHLELVRPFLEKGIPCFVDKPFASTIADAKAMVDLAIANGTALMNASILGHCDAGKAFKRRFEELGEPGLLTVKGVGFGNACVGHGIATAQGLFGYGVEAVECMGSLPDKSDWNHNDPAYHIEHLLLHYPDGRQVVIMNTDHKWFTANSDFYCSAYSKLGVIHSPGIGVREFPSGSAAIVHMFRKMIDTGKPPIPYEHILELVAIIEAARIAQKTGKRVAISDVWDRAS